MSHNFNQVMEQVHRLTRSEQLALIESIARMLVDDELDVLPESVIQENQRRLAAYDAGESKGIPYQEAMRSVREQMGGIK